MPDSDSDSKKNYSSFSKKVWLVGGVVSLIVIFLLLFKVIFSVLLLTLAGILIAVYFRGCADILHRNFHWPLKLCTFLSLFINILLLIGFFWFAGSRLQQQLNQLSDTLPKTIEHVKEQLSSSGLGKKVVQFINNSTDSEKTRELTKKFFSGSLGVVSDFYVVLLLAIFFTVDPKLYRQGIVRLLPPKAKDRGDKLLLDLAIVLKKWLKGQIINFFFVALFTGIGLWIVGMPLVFTLALIAGLLNFVPNFGPFIALLPGVLIALMKDPSMALIVVFIYLGVQIIQSAVLQPIVQQKMVNIPPALTIFTQVAFGLLAGVWGVVMATPIVALLIKIVNSLYVERQPYHKYELK